MSLRPNLRNYFRFFLSQIDGFKEIIKTLKSRGSLLITIITIRNYNYYDIPSVKVEHIKIIIELLWGIKSQIWLNYIFLSNIIEKQYRKDRFVKFIWLLG